jgi:hypothetical protein
VVRQLFTPENADPDVTARMEQALADLGRLGGGIEARDRDTGTLERGRKV